MTQVLEVADNDFKAACFIEQLWTLLKQILKNLEVLAKEESLSKWIEDTKKNQMEILKVENNQNKNLSE